MSVPPQCPVLLTASSGQTQQETRRSRGARMGVAPRCGGHYAGGRCDDNVGTWQCGGLGSRWGGGGDLLHLQRLMSRSVVHRPCEREAHSGRGRFLHWAPVPTLWPGGRVMAGALGTVTTL